MKKEPWRPRSPGQFQFPRRTARPNRHGGFSAAIGQRPGYRSRRRAANVRNVEYCHTDFRCPPVDLAPIHTELGTNMANLKSWDPRRLPDFSTPRKILGMDSLAPQHRRYLRYGGQLALLAVLGLVAGRATSSYLWAEKSRPEASPVVRDAIKSAPTLAERASSNFRIHSRAARRRQVG